MKKVYVAATEQHAGKTSVSLGLYLAAQERGYKACFIKPVGQRYVLAEGVQVDEDAVLFKHAFRAKGEMKDLNPVTIPRGFTHDYIFHREPERIHRAIMEAFNRLADGHDLAIIEGTGHAGVGSVVDSSNADVARMLEAPCIIISGGGIGRCIDEIALNRALFERTGTRMIGAVINKVYREKYERVSPALRQGLKNLGIECLGVIPYRQELTYPTISQIMEELKLEMLCGQDCLNNRVRSIIVAAMTPQNVVDYLEDGCLVVVPGDRVDNILASVNAHLMSPKKGAGRVAGLLLTGGFVPHLSILNILCQVEVPVLLSEADTATSAFNVRGLVAKITERDEAKIRLAQELVKQWVDVDRVFADIGTQ